MNNAMISDIEVYKLNVPFKEPFIISLGTIQSANNLVVRINLDDGSYGVGECSTIVYISGETQDSEFEISKTIASIIKGKDPYAIEKRLAEIDATLPGNYTLKSAFDMALYDLLGKKAGLPLYRLLGGDNTRVICTDRTVSIGSPEKMVSDALQFLKEGFPALKIKLGSNGELDVFRIKAIREAIGYDIPLRIDANQGWDPVTAIKTLKALEPFNIEYCEEPIHRWNNRELVRVRANSPIAIMADESVFDHRDAFRLAMLGACDYFNIKLSKSGGIHNALKIVAIAEASGIKCQVGCMNETRYALTALTHLAVAKNNIIYFDIDSCFFHSEDPVAGGIKYQGNGRWELPDTPGVGADFDTDILNKMERVAI